MIDSIIPKSHVLEPPARLLERKKSRGIRVLPIVLLTLVSFGALGQGTTTQYLSEKKIAENGLIPAQPKNERLPVQKMLDVAVKEVDLQNIFITRLGEIDPVAQVTSGQDYMMAFQTYAFGSEITFDQIQARIASLPNEVNFYDSCGSNRALTGLSIIIMHHTGPLSSNQRWNFFPCFRAQTTMRTKDMSIRLGMYGRVRPEGRYWVAATPRF